MAALYGELLTDFAVTSGVHTHEDVPKSLMAGAKVAMTASEFLRNGGRLVAALLGGGRVGGPDGRAGLFL